MIAVGAHPATQRVPFRVLHAGRLPRAACDRRIDLAGRDDGAGRGQGLSRHGGAAPALLFPVLARARHHLGLAVHGGLSDGSPLMTDTRYDRAPGDGSAPADVEEEPGSGVLIYTIGLLLAVILTAISFWVANTSLLWAPGVSLGLTVARHRADGRPSGVLPARHHRAGQHQQRDGAGIRRADCSSGRRWLAFDHGRSERQHDASRRVDELAPAALSTCSNEKPGRDDDSTSRPGLPLRSTSAFCILMMSGLASRIRTEAWRPARRSTDRIAQNRVEQYRHDFNSELWQTESEPAVSTVVPKGPSPMLQSYISTSMPIGESLRSVQIRCLAPS